MPLFTKTVFFYLDVESVDFARSQEAADVINAWCANATKNHILDIVTPGLNIRNLDFGDYPFVISNIVCCNCFF